MPETIWSNTSGNTNSFRNALDSMDPDVAKMLSYNDPLGGGDDLMTRRLSFNDGSDIDSNNRFGLKIGALSAITAPPGYTMNNAPSPQQNRLGLGTASISGGIANRHPPQDSFLQKFGSVGEATRDIELSNNFSNLNLENNNSRRTSFNSHQQRDIKIQDVNLGSPSGSINESLNLNNRNSRHQSISEKIDHYNSTSPIPTGATLTADLQRDGSYQSVNSNGPPNNQYQQPNFWNPATAASFTPSFYQQNSNNEAYMNNMMQFNPYNGRNGNQAPPPPQFMMPSPPYQFFDPRMYNYPTDSNEEESPKDEDKKDEKDTKEQKSNYLHQPGIGLPPRQMNPAFMFQPFSPYSMFQQSPPMMNVVPQEPVETEESEVPTPPETTTSTAPNPKKKSSKKTPTNGGPHIYRSPLLEEVRSNFKGKEYFLKDIYGHAIEFTKDQHGSRFIQQKLPDASEEEKEVIFNEIRDISYELMTDVFGNYVIQKYFEFGSKTQKHVLLDHMIGHIYDLSLQMYGCRVVQRALEAIELPGQLKIISELKDYVLICAKDQNGNHVIQKSIERIPFEKVRFILTSLDSQIYHLSTHPYGCRVIQRLLENSKPEDQKRILNELNRYIFYLIQDQYGNYVMQHVLERGSKTDREEILNIVLSQVVEFSKHKFASNVIEKCIKFGDLQQKKKVLSEVLKGNEDLSIEIVDDSSPLALMMKDQYANYVIQKLVEAFDTKSEEKRLLVLKLRQYLKQISSKNNYGKHLASVEKMIIVAETALIEADNS
ncbi:mRNA-binding protein Puf3p [[Candida] jaroonii]|uniref:mRNA-binding protein Puf3p n=1 Tax=[Candida] jaroonii TaxID=467808 RepID=A0ACA9Y3C0_9ASCO|nr:mRNA-binding protein Puf3p [[Candida] jaroonii]